MPDFLIGLDRRDAHDIQDIQLLDILSASHSELSFAARRKQIAEIPGARSDFDLQILVTFKCQDFFPLDADRAHRIGAVAEFAEFERLDLAGNGVAIQQYDDVRFGRPRGWHEARQQNAGEHRSPYYMVHFHRVIPGFLLAAWVTERQYY